jgi:hypothetical protein
MAKRPVYTDPYGSPMEGMPPPGRGPKQVHLGAEEYQHCRELMLENIRAMDRNEIYTLGAVAVTTGFSLSSTSDAVAFGSAFIPLALTWIARLRYIGLGNFVRSINDYLREMEFLNPSIGWTTFQRARLAPNCDATVWPSGRCWHWAHSPLRFSR